MRPNSPNSCLDADARRRFTVTDDIRTPAGLPAPELSQPVPVCLRQRSSTRCEYTDTHCYTYEDPHQHKYSEDLHLDLCFHSWTALSKKWGCGPVLFDEYDAFILIYTYIFIPESLIYISNSPGFCGGFLSLDALNQDFLTFSYLVFRAQNNILTIRFAAFFGLTL